MVLVTEAFKLLLVTYYSDQHYVLLIVDNLSVLKYTDNLHILTCMYMSFVKLMF